RQRSQAPPRKAKSQSCSETAEPVTHAAAKINRGSLRQIFRGTSDLADLATEPNYLREHLIIENKVIRIVLNWHSLEQSAREGTVASVIFGKLGPDHGIFHEGQKTVRHVFPPRHAAIKRAAA